MKPALRHAGEHRLHRRLAAERLPLTSRTLLVQGLKMPWMTLKVVAGIHWEALKLWLRGARYHPKPSPPNHESS